MRTAFREIGDYGVPNDNTERVSAMFLSSPANISVIASTFTPTFAESATNAILGTVVGSPAYIQWYTNNVLVAGATNTTFALPVPLPLAFSGVTVQVVATNSYSTASNQFTLTVEADTTAPTIVGVVRCNTWTNLVVNFSELVDPLSATNPANYVVVDGLGNVIAISGVFLRPDGRSVSISIPVSASFDPSATYYVTNNAITDRSVALNPITPDSVVTFNPLVLSSGFVAMDFYSGISGGSISNLTNDVRFRANTPDLQMALAGLEFHYTNLPFAGPQNYGAKFYGWFVPPSNATYRFSFRGDDTALVNMNPNGAAPGGKIQIGIITNCCNVYTSTAPVTLTAGTPYYLEFLYGQGGGQEYFSATWQSFPDELTAWMTPSPTSPGYNGVGWSAAGYFPSAEIGVGTVFGVYGEPTVVSNFSFTLQPTPAASTVSAGTKLSFAVMATNAPANGHIWYQWQADDGSGNFTNVGPSANYISDYAMLGNRSNYVASFYYDTTLRVVAQLPGGLSITSETATVTVPDIISVVSAGAFSSPTTNFITVVYSKPAWQMDAEEVVYYTVNDGEISMVKGTLQPDGRTVILGFVDPLPASVKVDIGPIMDVLMEDACITTVTLTPFRADFYGDIGSAPGVSDPILPGSFVNVAANAFDITASGSDIYNNADGEYFIGRLVTGDFDIRTRVTAITNAYRGISDANAKAALQARVTTAANSRAITVNVAPATPPGWPQTGADRTQMIVRDTAGGSSASLRDLANNFANGGSPWIRLVRQGSVFLGYRSLDGVNWTLVAVRDTALFGGAYPDTIYVGLAATSHNNAANPLSGTTLAQFRDVYFPSTIPTIVSQPVGASLVIGQSMILNVSAVFPPENGAVSYQWRKNGVRIIGANGPSLSLNNVNLSDAADYTVLVANDAGGVVSDVATISVANQPPLVATDNLNTVVNGSTNIAANLLLGNDSDPDGLPLSIVAVSGVAPVTFFTDFEAGIPENSTNYGVAHLVPGVGVNGSQALALTDAIGSQTGGWVINDLVPGRSVSGFSATFQVRLGDGSGNAADGMSFNVANNLPAGTVGEGEEGGGSGLSICLDQYNNVPSGQPDRLEAPAFDIKWRGAIVAHVPIVKATNQDWVTVSVNMSVNGVLDLYFGGKPIAVNLQTPFRPISGAQFGFFARTGGEFETHWLDDVAITVLTPETLFTPTPVNYAHDFNYGVLAGYSLFGNTSGGFNGGYQSNGVIHLTDGSASLQGAVVFDEITPFKPVNSFTASFNVLIGSASSEPADGMSFNFADDLPNATHGGAEEGVGTGLSVCWDMYRFPDGATANRSGIKVKYRGQTIAQQQLPPWNTNVFVPVIVTLSSSGTVMVNIDGTNVFANPVATGYQPQRGRFGFYARTGGQYAAHWIDDLSITLPDYGYVTLVNGNVFYAPSRNVCGADSFYYQVGDSQGGFAWTSANIGILDVTPPQIVSCATNRTVAPTLDCEATLPDYTANSGLFILETCGLTITQAPLPGLVLGLGQEVPVTLYAVDGVGNVATCTFVVTNVDNVPPVIAAVSDETFTAGAGTCAVPNSVLTAPEAADGCFVTEITNNAPAELTVGTNVVVWFAVDFSMNVGTATQVVVVVDAELPQITAPADVAVNADPGQNYASGVVLGTPEATDNCTLAAVTNNAPVVFPVGVTTVIWTAVDASGNFSTDSQTVTVTADASPQITCPTDVTVSATGGLCSATNVALGTPVVTGATMNTIVTNNAPAQFAVGTNMVTWSVWDPAGTNTCQQLVIVTESLPFIAIQPLSTNVLVGSSVSFTVSVASCSAPLYQWYADETSLVNQTNADLVISNLTSCEAGNYTVVISNAVGSVTSEVAVLVITNAPAVIAPGGELAVGETNFCGSLILAADAVYNVDISGMGIGELDRVNVATGIDVQATALNPFTINLASLNGLAADFDHTESNGWVIAFAPDGITNFSADKFVVNDAGFANDLAGGVFSVAVSATTLDLVFTPNHAPTAYTLTKNRGPGLPLRFNINDLLTNSVDIDGDPVVFEALGSSTNGAIVVADGNYIHYTNANDVVDSFTYTVRDQRAYRAGDTRYEITCTVNITVNAPAGTNLVINTPALNGSGKPTLRFSGIPGYEYEVQRAPNLDAPIDWTTVLTTNAPVEGWFELTDETAPAGMGFYRAIRK